MKSIALSIGLMLTLSPGINAAEPAWSLEQAEERIRQHRMSDAVVEFVLPDGSAIHEGAVVQATQTRHAFHFGGSLTQAWTIHSHPLFEQYLERFAGIFNYATLGFYWSWHERRPGAWQLAEHTQRTLQFAKQQGMTVKGHPMMWHNCLPKFVDQEQDLEQVGDGQHRPILPCLKWARFGATGGSRCSPPWWRRRFLLRSIATP